MVCLSEYIPIYVIKVEPERLFHEETRSRVAIIFGLKCRLDLPVVRKVSGLYRSITMKSIDMYILHASTLVVSFSNILA